MNSHQRPFTGNVVQRIIFIFEESCSNELKTTKQNTYIPRRFMRVGVVQYDWLHRHRQWSHACRTECRIQGHTVGLLNPKFTLLKLRRQIETSGPVIKWSCSYWNWNYWYLCTLFPDTGKRFLLFFVLYRVRQLGKVRVQASIKSSPYLQNIQLLAKISLKFSSWK